MDNPKKISRDFQNPVRPELVEGERGFGSYPMGEVCLEPFILRQAQHERLKAHFN